MRDARPPAPRLTDMADTLESPPTATAPPPTLEAPAAAKRFRWLTDRWLAALFVSPALALLVFLSIWPLIRLIWLSFTDYSVTRDVPASFIGFENYIDVLTSPVVRGARAHDADLRRRRGRAADRARVRDRVPDLAPRPRAAARSRRSS